MKKSAILFSVVLFMCACNGDKDLFQKARLETSKGNLTQAIQIYSRLIKKNPQHAAAHTNRGILWERLPAQNPQERAKNLANAEQDYQKALELNPHQAETYNNLGALYLDAKRYNDAIYYFTQALAYRPNYFMALMNRGIAYSRLGYVADSLDDFKRAQQLNDHEPLLYLNRGLAYFDLSQ